jgi:hypothetical protein
MKMGRLCRVPFSTENSGSKPSSLAIPTAIAPEKGRFAPENWAARKAAFHDASNPPGSGTHTEAGGQEATPDRLAAPRGLWHIRQRL